MGGLLAVRKWVFLCQQSVLIMYAADLTRGDSNCKRSGVSSTVIGAYTGSAGTKTKREVVSKFKLLIGLDDGHSNASGALKPSGGCSSMACSNQLVGSQSSSQPCALCVLHRVCSMMYRRRSGGGAKSICLEMVQARLGPKEHCRITLRVSNGLRTCTALVDCHRQDLDCRWASKICD